MKAIRLDIKYKRPLNIAVDVPGDIRQSMYGGWVMYDHGSIFAVKPRTALWVFGFTEGSPDALAHGCFCDAKRAGVVWVLAKTDGTVVARFHGHLAKIAIEAGFDDKEAKLIHQFLTR